MKFVVHTAEGQAMPALMVFEAKLSFIISIFASGMNRYIFASYCLPKPYIQTGFFMLIGIKLIDSVDSVSNLFAVRCEIDNIICY